MSAVLVLFEGSESWSALTKAYFYMGAGASVVLVFQMTLMMIGIGEGDTDVDADTDLDDATDGLALFSFRALTAFACLFGWTGFAPNKVEPDFSFPSSVPSLPDRPLFLA